MSSPADAHVAVAVETASVDASLPARPPFDPMHEPPDAVGTVPLSEAEAVATFEKDCAARFTEALAGEPGPRFELGDECTSTDMDQMCDPDTYGCFQKKQECKAAGGSECTS